MKMIKREIALDIDLINEAVNRYGAAAQETVCIEECSELIQAITKQKRGFDNRKNLAEEMADVYICLEYLRYNYSIENEDIDFLIMQKQKRLKSRMQQEKELLRLWT